MVADDNGWEYRILFMAILNGVHANQSYSPTGYILDGRVLINGTNHLSSVI